MPIIVKDVLVFGVKELNKMKIKITLTMMKMKITMKTKIMMKTKMILKEFVSLDNVDVLENLKKITVTKLMFYLMDSVKNLNLTANLVMELGAPNLEEYYKFKKKDNVILNNVDVLENLLKIGVMNLTN